MKQQLLHTPEGVRDIYNEECARKNVLQENLRQVMQLYGYRDIQTPTIEFFDVFSKEIGTTPSRELYKFFDREGNTLVLRPDITPSVARSAAKYFMDEKLPLRMCYMGNTFINHSSYQGRLKETTQMGAELIGDGSVDADAEVIALVVEALLKAGLKDFQVSIGQIDFFKGLLDQAGIEEETEEMLRELISNKNHFGIEEMVEEQQLSVELKKVFLKMPELFGGVAVLDAAKELTRNDRSLQALERLRELYEVLCCYGYEPYISFDLGMISKYHYYTGVIFRAYTYGTGDAIVKGGRYDNLLGHFGKEAPSIGFAIVIDQLMMALSRQKIDIPLSNSTTLLIYEEPLRKAAIPLAVGLRKTGARVEMLLKSPDHELPEYLEYARRNRIGGLLILRPDGKIEMIHMSDGSRQTVNLKDLTEGV